VQIAIASLDGSEALANALAIARFTSFTMTALVSAPIPPTSE
jgi:hypothetical protein